MTRLMALLIADNVSPESERVEAHAGPTLAGSSFFSKKQRLWIEIGIQQVPCRDAERQRDALEAINGYVSFAAFKATDVGPMQSSAIR